LKLGDGTLILKCMVRLLKVFLCLHQHSSGKQAEYVTVVTAQMLIFASWIEANTEADPHPLLTQFLTEPSVFNEEAGEISLSVMSRGMSSRGSCSDRGAYQKEFRAMHDRMKTARDLKMEMISEEVDDRSEAKERIEQMTDAKVKDEVDSITAHFKTVFRNVKARSWRPAKGNWKLFNTRMDPTGGPLTAAKVEMKKVPMTPVWFTKSTLPLLKTAMQVTTRYLHDKDWVSTFGSQKWGVDKKDEKSDAKGRDGADAKGQGVAPHNPAPSRQPRPSPPSPPHPHRQASSSQKAKSTVSQMASAVKPRTRTRGKNTSKSKRKRSMDGSDDDDDGGGGDRSGGGGGGGGPSHAQTQRKKTKHDKQGACDAKYVGVRVVVPGAWWIGGKAKMSYPGIIHNISSTWEGSHKKRNPEQRYIVHLDSESDQPLDWGVAAAAISSMIHAAAKHKVK
jgi:hypothetical protein